MPTYSVNEILTDEEIAAINAQRDPESKIRPTVKCGADLKSGRTCERRAGGDTTHFGWGNCAKHGGNTPAGKRYAAHLMGEAVIERHRTNIVRFGGDRNDPSIANMTAEQALLEEVRRSVAMVRWLEEMIGSWNYGTKLVQFENDAWDPEAADKATRHKGYPSGNPSIEDAIRFVDQNPLESPTGLGGLPALVSETDKGIASTTDVAEWLKIYREERLNGARIAKMCIDSGIAHRMVSIAEEQGRVLSSAIRAVLNHLGLSQMQIDLVPQVVPAILRATASGQPIPEDLPRLEAVRS